MSRSVAGRAETGARLAPRLLLCCASVAALVRPLAADAGTLLFRGDTAARGAWETSIHLPGQRHVLATDLQTACGRVGHTGADLLVYDLSGRSCERYDDARLGAAFLPDLAEAALTHEGRFFSVTVGQLVHGGGLVYFDAEEMNAFSVFPETRPRITSPGPQTTGEGQTVSLPVVATDSEGGALAYAASGLPPGLTINATTGRITGTLSYTTAGSYSVTVTVTDPIGLSAAAVFAWSVTNTNRAPVLAAVGNQTIAEGAPLSIVLSGSDPDGDTPSFGATGLPAGATFDAGTRTFSWTPGYDQASDHVVTFTVSDGDQTDFEPITIAVTNTNRAPVLGAIGERSCAEGESLVFVLPADDPDGQTLTCDATGLPAGAILSPTTCAFSWTPAGGQARSYHVTFTVSDGDLADEQTITITVTNTNRAPQIAPIGDQALAEGETLLFRVVVTDPDGNGVNVSVIGLPEGAAFDAATGAFAWTPRLDQTARYLVTFRATDDATPSLSAEETVAITVTAPAGPVFSDDFADGAAAEDWQSVSGNWAASKGVYAATNPRAKNVAQILPLQPTGFPLSAGIIQGRVKLTSTASRTGPNGMLVFAYQNAGQYRWVKLTRDQVLVGQTGSFGGVGAGTKKRVFKSQPLNRFVPLKVKIFPDGRVLVYKGAAASPILSYRFVAGGQASVVPGGAGLAAMKAKTIFDDVVVWDDSALAQ